MHTFAIVCILLIAAALLSPAKRQTAALERMERQKHEAQHPNIPPEIVALAQSGDLIAAIKAYRALTGCTLEIAKARLDPFVPSARNRSTENLLMFVVMLAAVAAIVGIAMAITD